MQCFGPWLPPEASPCVDKGRYLQCSDLRASRRLGLGVMRNKLMTGHTHFQTSFGSGRCSVPRQVSLDACCGGHDRCSAMANRCLNALVCPADLRKLKWKEHAGCDFSEIVRWSYVFGWQSHRVHNDVPPITAWPCHRGPGHIPAQLSAAHSRASACHSPNRWKL